MSADDTRDPADRGNGHDTAGAAPFVPATNDLDALRQAAAGCHGCELFRDATQTVFGRGASDARLVLVGEQPGDVEDERGAPFVGPAGRLLVRAVDEAGIDRNEIWVTNAVKHFRFTMRGKRRIHQTPEAVHIAACKPWLSAELRSVAPDVVVCLGATATRALLGTTVRVMRDRGVVLERETTLGTKRFLVTVHPSAILRAPDADRPSAYAALVADLRVAAAAAAT
jgi:uracil-DNA glycosylase